jgi:sortase A
VSRKQLLRALERGLRGLGIGCLSAYLGLEAHAYVEQRAQSLRLDAQLREGSATVADSSPARSPAAPLTPVEAAVAPPEAPRAPDPEVVGRLEVPQIGLRTMVASGDGESTLMWAAGLVPGSARPGEPGNVVIAGHRDRNFWPLQRIKVGDHLRLVTPGRTFDYFVDWTTVVEPDRVDLLGPTDEPSLTLVTCYPFEMIGRAPKRFIVRARLSHT